MLMTTTKSFWQPRAVDTEQCSGGRRSPHDVIQLTTEAGAALSSE